MILPAMQAIVHMISASWLKGQCHWPEWVRKRQEKKSTLETSPHLLDSNLMHSTAKLLRELP